jgi:hypothetical protein
MFFSTRPKEEKEVSTKKLGLHIPANLKMEQF